MFISTIIPTIGRPTLSRAVESVLNQTIISKDVDFEIIVVNDSGRPLAVEDWQQSKNVRIINTSRRKPCVARNSGAAIAKGKYLHFLDDDDWLHRDAMSVFWRLAESNPDASLLYGGIEFIDSEGNNLGELNLNKSGNCISQLIGGAWIPIGSEIVKTEDYFSVGGFDPQIFLGDETDLWIRISLRGKLANSIATVVYISRGIGRSSSASHSIATENNRIIRNRSLNEGGVFKKLRDSADNSYWRGRIYRVYIATALWNWRQRRFFTFLSRTLWGILWFFSAGLSLFSIDFWRGLQDTQPPSTADRVLN